MTQSITLELPDAVWKRYKQGALAAGQVVEQFITNRLVESPLPLGNDHYSDLDKLEVLDDDTLWTMTELTLPAHKQRLYEQLLTQNRVESLSQQDEQLLHQLGDEARFLALQKAHAYMILKWRGYKLPSLEELSQTVQ